MSPVFRQLIAGVIVFVCTGRTFCDAQDVGAKFVITIGNQAYAAGWPALSTPTSDSKAISDQLSKFGFSRPPEQQKSSIESKQNMEEMIAALQKRPPFDSLVFYFAGHGGHPERIIKGSVSGATASNVSRSTR